ncbi:uncharacterized protein LOC134776481 [Penaeus indicus]|uniref:uncharacterized protein LOC134776481 n=1 Tax=Penaeus indicus TaxID=29960 RepID=UPI00300CBC80
MKQGWVHHPLSYALLHLGPILSHPSLVTPPLWVALKPPFNHMLAVVKFQKDGEARKDTLLRYLGSLPRLSAVTSCFRVNLRQARNSNAILSYAVREEPNELFIGFSHENKALELLCCGDVLQEEWNYTLPLREWVSVCVAIDFQDRYIKFLFGGEIIQHSFKVSGNPLLEVRGGGLLVFGQDQDSYGGGYINIQSLCATLADLRIYDYCLNDDELMAYSDCSLDLATSSSPIVSFSDIERDFEAMNVEISQIQNDEYCGAQRNDILIFPEFRSFKEAKHLCHISGGELMVPRSEEEIWKLFSKTVYYINFCNSGSMTSFWLGVKGNVTSQSWEHYATGSELNYTNFVQHKIPVEEPNICVGFAGNNNTNANQHGGWYSVSCRLRRCPICLQDEVVLLKARGLCKDSLFDRQYFLTNDKGLITFTGVYYSMITRHFPSNDTDDLDYGFWLLNRLDKPSVWATLRMDSPTHYPLGRHLWRVENDVCGNSTMSIIITACKEQQFSCSDGTCVELRQRCDMELDCPDDSDEMGCEFLTLAPSYNSDNPPPRQDITQPVQVEIHIDIYAIRKIDVANFQFTCEVEVTMEWFDSRLRFRHLNNATELNSLTGLEQQPWRPKLEFLGDRNTASDVQERWATLSVRRYTMPLDDNDEEEFESEVFEGEGNSLLQVQKLTVTTPCQFYLEKFPFDQQHCSMGLKMSGITKDYIALNYRKDSITFSGRRRMLEYVLVKETIDNGDVGNYSGVEVQLYLRNLSNFYITSTYVPTFIIVVIGYLVFFFPITNFNERIMVGLTGLLVEATFFSQVNSSIPHTAYMKLVDIWMVFCILTLFQVVVSVVVLHWILEESSRAPLIKVEVSGSSINRNVAEWRKRKAVKMNRFCRFFTPVVTVIFLSVYTVLAAQV